MTTSIKRRLGRIVTKFASVKNRKTILVRSSLIKDFLYHLELNAEVIAYEETSHKVFYPLNGKYIPFHFNFSVEYKNRKELVVIRPAAHTPIHPGVIEKISESCSSSGYTVGFYEEQQIRLEPYLNNLKILYKYNLQGISPDHHIALYRCFKNRFAISLEELQSYFAENNFRPSVIYTLLFHNVLTTDLNQPLSKNSVILPSASAAVHKEDL